MSATSVYNQQASKQGGGGGSLTNISNPHLNGSSTVGLYFTNTSTTSSSITSNIAIAGSTSLIGLDQLIQSHIAKMAKPPVGFNRYVNASDRMEEFIKYCGKMGLTQDETMALPIQTFIMWLLVEAAEWDGEPAEEKKLLPALIKPNKRARCKQCGRFIRKTLSNRQMFFCSPEHYGKAMMPA